MIHLISEKCKFMPSLFTSKKTGRCKSFTNVLKFPFENNLKNRQRHTESVEIA